MKKFIKLFTILLVFVFALPLIPKNFNKEEIIKNLPKMLGANNVGREFYFSFIPSWESAGGINDLRLYISSGVETKVVVSVSGKGYEKIQYTKPNDIIQFVLSPAIGQPYRKTDRDVPEVDQVWPGAGVHVVADDPIICYGMTRFQYTSDGFLAIPVPSLGKDYIVASYADPSPNTNQWLPSYTSVTAPYDKTKVKFTMGGNDWSKTAAGTLPGETTQWNLNEGDVLLIAGLGEHADLTGSIIQATKPVGVVSGNFCAYIPTNCGCCDVIEEMELPTSSWGTQYHVTKIIDRKKNSIIKIFAKEAKTTIYRDYLQMGFVRNAGGVLGEGYLEIRADDGAPRPIVISGDKPISVTQYNTGQSDDGVTSDPFQMLLTPIEQYQKEIIFNTPGIRGGFGFTTNYINLCYEATPLDSIPNDLEFAKVVDGKFEWQKISELYPDSSEAFAKKDSLDKTYYSKTLLLPGDGVYKIRADKPFAAYAYGFASYDSYGFPASIALGDIAKIDTLPPEPKWELSCDGNVNYDVTRYVIDKPDDIDNRSNLATIYMHKDISYNYKLYNGDFMPCEDPITSWRLNIIDNSEDAFAVVTFADCRGNDTTLFIEYNATKVKIAPGNSDFGNIRVGDTVEKMFYVVNYSDKSPLELDFLQLLNKDDNNNPQGFTLWNEQGSEPIHLPQIIQPLDSLPFIVRFTASQEGEFWDSIGLGDSCDLWYKTYLGVKVGEPLIQVSDCNFPITTINDTIWNQFNIKNIGTIDLELYGYTGPFMTGSDDQGNTYPIYLSKELKDKNIDSAYGETLILSPQDSIIFHIRFIPDKEMRYTDSIVFSSNTAKSTNDGTLADSICLLNGEGNLTTVRDKIISNGISISPNPADNRLNFEINNKDILLKSIKIMDIKGYKIYSKQLNNNLSSIDLSKYPNGTYFLNVVTNKGIFKQKFIIKH